jgi:protein transport protein SEC61 subunit gamma and related proteins
MDEIQKPSLWGRLKAFANECWRVLIVTKKPDRVEFATIVKVSALGMAIIGGLGFMIQMIWDTLK